MPRRGSMAQDTAGDCLWHTAVLNLASNQAGLPGEAHYIGSTACKPGKLSKLSPAIPKTV